MTLSIKMTDTEKVWRNLWYWYRNTILHLMPCFYCFYRRQNTNKFRGWDVQVSKCLGSLRCPRYLRCLRYLKCPRCLRYRRCPRCLRCPMFVCLPGSPSWRWNCLHVAAASTEQLTDCSLKSTSSTRKITWHTWNRKHLCHFTWFLSK